MAIEYEIYALKYAGPFKRPGPVVLWNKEWERTFLVNYYFWCIKGGNETIIVDAGMTPALAEELKLTGYVHPAEILSRIHIDVNQIKKVILTHLHFDHDDGVSLFPNATFYVQEDEYLFWTKNPIAKRPPFLFFLNSNAIQYLKSIENSHRIQLIQGDQFIAPGIECLLTPGHSVGNQSVAVSTIKGTAVLGSDCAHFFRNYQEDWPSIFIVNLIDWMKSYDKVKAKVSSMGLLFPGHDPALADQFPSIAEGVTRLV